MYCGYVRVSTDEQAEQGYGIQTQTARIESYAQALGLDLGEIITDDGYSGATLERPGLEKLLQKVEAGDVEGVIIFKLDRLSRSLRNLLNIYSESFERYNVALISVSEQFDTSSASGRMFFQMLGSFSEFERAVITERMTEGRRQKAKKGGYAGGRPPIGYQAGDHTKALEIESEGAKTVRMILQLKEEQPSLTLQELANTINNRGRRTAQGKRFHSMQIKRILDRKAFYGGVYSYAGITSEGQYHAIV